MATLSPQDMASLSSFALLNSNPRDSHNRVSVFEEDAAKLKEKTSNTLYQQVAKQIGINNLNSWNDVRQIESYLARSGGQGGSSRQSGTSASGTGSSSGSGSSGSSGGSGSSSSSGGNLSSQQQLGQSTAQSQRNQASDLQAQLDMLTMENQRSSQQMVDLMNFQALQTSFGQQQQEMQMKFALLQGQQQFAASQAQAQMQMLAMQQQQQQMLTAVAEQTRLAQNMAKAYVPDVKKTAGFTPVGDLRSGQSRTSSKLSELQDLALLPGAAAVSPSKTMTNTLVVA